MKYAETGQGNFADDASLEGIEHAEEGEGFGIPGQSTKGVVGFVRWADIGNQDENSTGLTAPTGHSTIELTKEPGVVSNEGLSSVSPGSLSPIINGTKGNEMSARIAYIMENGEPFCNHCETNFVPRDLRRVACTNCGCGQPANDHGSGAHLFQGKDLSTTEGSTVADKVEGANEGIVKEDHTASVNPYLAMFNKESNDSQLYYQGYNDAHAGKPLDEDLALLSDDYFHGYEQYKFYNKTPQQSIGQSLYDLKPNSNSIPRDEKMRPEDYDRGPLQLTDGIGHVTASRSPFPVDVIKNFFEVE